MAGEGWQHVGFARPGSGFSPRPEFRLLGMSTSGRPRAPTTTKNSL